MDLVFPWPMSPGGWLAFVSAAVTAVLGVLVLAFAAMRPRRGQTLVESRTLLACFLLANGLGCMLLDQQLGYLVLGGAWALAVPARLAAMAAQGRAGQRDIAMLLLAAALALMPIAYVFGYV